MQVWKLHYGYQMALAKKNNSKELSTPRPVDIPLLLYICAGKDYIFQFIFGPYFSLQQSTLRTDWGIQSTWSGRRLECGGRMMWLCPRNPRRSDNFQQQFPVVNTLSTELILNHPFPLLTSSSPMVMVPLQSWALGAEVSIFCALPGPPTMIRRRVVAPNNKQKSFFKQMSNILTCKFSMSLLAEMPHKKIISVTGDSHYNSL